MYEINREAFASFLTKLRKAKGWTQKDLAEKLLVSDKAVSKWERGLSMPDISLLIPLAENLGVTVTELLEGRRLENPEPMAADQVEELVKKTITLSEGGPRLANRRKEQLAFGGAVAVMLLEELLLYLIKDSIGLVVSDVFQFLALLFGVYFWFFMADRLPDYYDQNRIAAFYDGPFRMNIPGVYFNNGNWLHIRKYLRYWSVVVLVIEPLLSLALGVLPDRWELAGEMVLLAVFLGSLFVPVIVIGRRFDSGKTVEKRKKRWMVYTLILAAVVVLLATGGSVTRRGALRIGYVESSRGNQWSASYRSLDGGMSRYFHLEDTPVQYTLTVETEEGILGIHITGEDGDVFSQTELSAGTYVLTLEGTVYIQIEAQNHRGSFSLKPNTAS